MFMKGNKVVHCSLINKVSFFFLFNLILFKINYSNNRTINMKEERLNQ